MTSSPDSLGRLTSGLGNSLHVVTPGLGHGPSWTTCFATLAAGLIETGSLEGLDATCVNDFEPAAFRIP